MTDKIICSMSEIAELVGLTRQRVHQLKETLPPPDLYIKLPAWKTSTIEKWNEARPKTTGRPRK